MKPKKYARFADESAKAWLSRIYDLGMASAVEKGTWAEIDEELLNILLDNMGALLTDTPEVTSEQPLTGAEAGLAELREKIVQIRGVLKESRWPLVSRRSVCTELFLLTLKSVRVRV